MPVSRRNALALLAGTTLRASDAPDLAIVEKVAGAVGFYTEDGRQLAQVKVGDFPHEAVLSPDNTTLYVSDNGVLWMTEDKLGTNTISIVDVRAMRKTGQIDLGKFHRPHGIAIVPGSRNILATTERPFGLVMVDPKTRKVVRDYGVQGKSPHMVMPSRDGRLAFVSNTDSNTVAAIDLASGRTMLIPTSAHPQGGVFSHTGDLLYLVNSEGPDIAIIDTVALKVVGKIPTGKGPGRIALTPDGKTLIYNLQFEPAVGFADVASRKQVAQVPLTARSLSLTLSRDGKRAYTGVQEQDKVAVLSVAARKIERVIELPKGSGPDPVISLR
jgi:YVTN family beta-propeller protein